MAVSQITAIKPNGSDISLDSLYTWAGTNAYGRDRVSLTEWATSTIPQVAIGSIFEAGGAYYSVDSNTSIGGSPTDGDCYILFNDGTSTFQFTNTLPVWDSEKFGYYDTSTGYKALNFLVIKDSGSYYKKVEDFKNRILATPLKYFKAFLTATKSITTLNAWTTVKSYDTIEGNSESLFNNTTGYFTCNLTGIYAFTFKGYIVPASGSVNIGVHRNDTEILTSSKSSINKTPTDTAIILLNAGDTVSVSHYATGNFSLLYETVGSLVDGAYFSGYKIG